MAWWERKTETARKIAEERGIPVQNPAPPAFPILYEDYFCVVYHNDSGEIFVKSKADHVVLRITPGSRGIDLTCFSGIFRPKMGGFTLNKFPTFDEFPDLPVPGPGESYDELHDAH